MKRKTCVLIHGCHVDAVKWENIIWGDPQNGILGRVAKGFKLAIEIDADLIFIGTGASERNGIKECVHMYTYGIDRINELHLSRWYNEGWMNERLVLDSCSQNTREEVLAASEVCKAYDIDQLILVSSPTHIARCLQVAMTLKSEGFLEGIEISATPSDTCFANSKPSDVVIIEPPHRGDDPMLNSEIQMHKIIPQLFRLPFEERVEALKQLQSVVN